MAIMIPLFWLLMLFYGLSLLRASKKRNIGITLITLFFLPIVLSPWHLLYFLCYATCNEMIITWPCGPMDKASDYESRDSRFASWKGRIFL